MLNVISLFPFGIRIIFFSINYIFVMLVSVAKKTYFFSICHSEANMHSIDNVFVKYIPASTWQNVSSGMCIQWRVNVSAQSDQSLRCPHEETLHPWLPKVRPMNILIRLRECAGWSESSLGAHVLIIKETRLYNVDPLKPHFYIVKLGFTGVHIISLISAQKHRLWYSLEPPRRGGSNEYPQSMFLSRNKKIIRIFYLKIFYFSFFFFFLVEKF